jgi:hypothetical protein
MDGTNIFQDFSIFGNLYLAPALPAPPSKTSKFIAIIVDGCLIGQLNPQHTLCSKPLIIDCLPKQSQLIEPAAVGMMKQHKSLAYLVFADFISGMRKTRQGGSK